jgi:DNA primase
LAPFIPEEKIAEIKDACSIVDVVGETVLLKKAGKNYLGLCPFHSEKTPSFTVSPDKQMFYCFGCGEGGNVFSYLMKQQGMTFPEAVKSLAERTGIALPVQRQTREQKRRLSEREAIFELNQLSMGLYRKTLRSDPRGKAARDYLHKRGFRPEVIDAFHLGFAPAGWDNLARYFERNGVSLEMAEKAGLVTPRKQGQGYYDRFRERIIFPILNNRGRVIAFGGRVLDDALPKYLNSPETEVYRKSYSLYGLDIALSHCRAAELVYIVEGYFDVIALHQNGVRNVVGTLGTALTNDHVRMLRGHIGQSGRAILVFDSDEAGIKAAHRSIDVFAREFVDARILVLPPGHDPDTFMMKFGAQAFIEKAQAAKGIMPFLIDAAIERHGTSMEGRINALGDLVEPMAAYEDPVARSVYIKYLAERVDIDEAAILEKIRQVAATPAGGASGGPSGRREAPASTVKKASGGSPIERQLVAMMLQFPDILPEVRKQNIATLIDDPVLRAIAQDALEGKASAAPVEDRHEAERMETLRRLKAELSLHEEDWEYQGCLRFIHHFVATRQRRKAPPLYEQIKQAERTHDEERWLQLLKEKQKQIDLVKAYQADTGLSKEVD